HSWHTGDVVGLITRKGQIVGKALGADTKIALDVVIAELLARSKIPIQVPTAHQLRKILVAGDEGRAHALLAHEASEGPDDVVILVLRAYESGKSEVPAQLAAVLELHHQIHRGGLAVRLVSRIEPVAIGVRGALVEGHRDITGADSLDQIAQETREAKHRVCRMTVPVHHRQARVIGAKDVNRGVNQKNQASAPEAPPTLAAGYEVMSGSIRATGATRIGSRQKPRFLPAVDEVMSAEIAGSNFRQSNNTN